MYNDVNETVCDNTWHTLFVAKSGKKVSIAVDEEEPISTEAGGIYVSVDATLPLTLGRTAGKCQGRNLQYLGN